MKERPILFSGEMVRAILSDKKTMTRRVVKPQPEWIDEVRSAKQAGPFMWPMGALGQQCGAPITRLPYGVPTDHLWVRERARVLECRNTCYGIPGGDYETEIRIRYEADGTECWVSYPERLRADPDALVGKCLPYGGHREASRITLEVTEVRVERLQSITPLDAIDEGAMTLPNRPTYEAEAAAVKDAERVCGHPLPCPIGDGPVTRFRRLWDQINGKRTGCSWENSPFVWVVSFRRVTP